MLMNQETLLLAILNMQKSMPDLIGDLINVNKYLKLYEVINEIAQCQEYIVNFTPQPVCT